MNSVNLIGRLTADPELRYTPKGTAVCDCNLAVDDGYGENKKTLFIGLQVWDKSAESFAQHLRKGRQIGVTGRLSQDTWEDKETGKKRSKTHVTVHSWDFGAEPRGAAGAPAEPRNSPPPQQRATDPVDEDDDSPLPF